MPLESHLHAVRGGNGGRSTGKRDAAPRRGHGVSQMKIAINVKKETALKAGLDRYGYVVIEIPAESLTGLQREALAAFGASTTVGDHPNKKEIAADFALKRVWGGEAKLPEYLPTEESVRSTLTLLGEQLHKQREDELKFYENAVSEVLSAGAEGLVRRPDTDKEWSMEYILPHVKTDPRLSEVIAAAQAIIDSHNREVSQKQQEVKAATAAAVLAAKSSPVVAKAEECKITWTPASLQLRDSDGSHGTDWFAAPERVREEVAKREAEFAEYSDWVTAHGSQRLKRCLSEGINCGSCYRDERLAFDRPGWRWERSVAGKYNDPRNPTDEAFELLDSARATLPSGTESRLVYWVESDDSDSWRGYAVISDFMGREIVFGGPEE